MNKYHCIDNLRYVVQYYGRADKNWHDIAAFPYSTPAAQYASSCKVEQPENEWRVIERRISEVAKWSF